MSRSLQGVAMFRAEAQCPIPVVLCGGIVGVVGVLCVLFSVPSTLTGLFVGPHILLVAIAYAIVGASMLVLTWGLFQRRVWAWWGTLSLALLLCALMCFWIYQVGVVEGVTDKMEVVFPASVGLVFGLVFLLLVQRGTFSWFGSPTFWLRTLIVLIFLVGFGLGLVKWCVDWVRADQVARGQQSQTSVAPTP